MTLPQVILLNHASQVNRSRLDRKMDDHRKNQSGSFVDKMEADMNQPLGAVYNGKRLDQLTTEEYVAYLSS